MTVTQWIDKLPLTSIQRVLARQVAKTAGVADKQIGARVDEKGRRVVVFLDRQESASISFEEINATGPA